MDTKIIRQVPGMENAQSDKRLVTVLHSMIMDGRLKPGEKISEVGVANMFDVSRTPARLALRALEVEGLIKKREGRGFTVQEFNLGDIKRAYEVRGVLEGLGASTLAKSGMSDKIDALLLNVIEEMDEALTGDMSLNARIERYQEGNITFHETIMRQCGNPYVSFAFDRMETLPMIKLGSVVFKEENAEQELMRLRFGNMQHRLIHDAISKRDSQRAEAMMREHANQTLVYTELFNET
ncbi:GntR family transcriptional regulator [Roseibium sp. SCPC15]|uniref:GntR family transcriptional regulator n=1 Tax=Roseibium sp. SCP15 TaxID=3141376 RepID=UPI003334D175